MFDLMFRLLVNNQTHFARELVLKETHKKTSISTTGAPVVDSMFLAFGLRFSYICKPMYENASAIDLTAM